MDKLSRYQNLIKGILSQYIEWDSRQPIPGIESLLIADDERGHYILMELGWSQERRILRIRVYARIRDDKIWIEEDWTEEGIANELVRAGVPKEDIVLAFHEPEMRHYTEFAVA